MPWRWMKLRDAKVLARCDDAGDLRVDQGRVEIRYSANEGKAYQATKGLTRIRVSEPTRPN